MERNKTKRDVLPENFKSVDAFVQFWETHDTEDYPAAWREVPVTVTMKTRKYPRIVLERTVALQLDKRAHQQGVSLNKLVNQLLKETLKHTSRQ